MKEEYVVMFFFFLFDMIKRTNNFHLQGRVENMDEKWAFEKSTQFKVPQLVESSLQDSSRTVIWIGSPGIYITDPIERGEVS